MGRTVNSLRGKLARVLDGAYIEIEHLLYCPDYLCKTPQTVGVMSERIVDAGRRDALCTVIQQILPAGSEGPLYAQVHRFLCDVIQLEADASALVAGQGPGHPRVQRSGVLGPANRHDALRLHVNGTAGSGKTQLALAEYRAAIEAGRRPLYLCFNRPLADHVAAIVPAGGVVCTFHMLCVRMAGQSGAVPDFNAAMAFEQLVNACRELAVPRI